MAKRTSRNIRKDILKALDDGKEHTYGDLERKVDTNWETVRNHCKDLELFNAVLISKNKHIQITKQGRELLNRM